MYTLTLLRLFGAITRPVVVDGHGVRRENDYVEIVSFAETRMMMFLKSSM
jgi:hypothetical protein